MSIQSVSGSPAMPVPQQQMPERGEAGASLRQAQNSQASSSGVAVDPLRAEGAAKRTEETRAEDSRAELDRAVESVSKFVNNENLEFSVDDETGRTVVKLIDRETDEVLRQFPSEEMLQIARALDKLQGLLVHQQA